MKYIILCLVLFSSCVTGSNFCYIDGRTQEEEDADLDDFRIEFYTECRF